MDTSRFLEEHKVTIYITGIGVHDICVTIATWGPDFLTTPLSCRIRQLNRVGGCPWLLAFTTTLHSSFSPRSESIIIRTDYHKSLKSPKTIQIEWEIHSLCQVDGLANSGYSWRWLNTHICSQHLLSILSQAVQFPLELNLNQLFENLSSHPLPAPHTPHLPNGSL